jgi:hypothetical protein
MIPLERPTDKTVLGPRFRGDARRWVVEYDYEHDDGSTEWSAVIFEEVLDVEFRQQACCTGEDVVGASAVTCLDESERLSGAKQRWYAAVGWQEWQQQKGGETRFKHFKMFFDDAGCLDVIAAVCRPSPHHQETTVE